MQCLILAGGFATRLWPLTEFRAKPLLPLAGKALLSHTVERLPLDLPIIISTNQAYAEDFVIWKKDFPERKIEIFIEDAESDDAKPGALAGVSLAIRKLKLDDDILLLAGDNYFGFEMEKFLAHFSGEPLLAAYDIGSLSQAKKYGVVVAEGGYAVEFQEKPAEPRSTLVSTGAYVLPRGVLKEVVSYAEKNTDNLGGLFEYFLHNERKVKLWTFSEKWFDIGSFSAYLAAHKFLVDNQQIILGEIRRIDSQLRGSIVLGNNVRLENTVIVDSVILNDCSLSDCVIKNSIVDEGVSLRGIDLDHKMIRAGAQIRA